MDNRLKKLAQSIVEGLVDCGSADHEPVQQYLTWTENKLSPLLEELAREREMRAHNLEIKTLLAEKVEGLETKLWESQQLVDVKAEHQNELRSQIRGLEESNRKDMAWRGERLCELEDSLEAAQKRIAELEQKLATPVRLPDIRSDDYHETGWFQHMKYYRDVERSLRAAGLAVGDE
ncbi:hypothetical protein [Serratia proteamaculans]|uniref:hypothetical protein n=1 Tax=Serratia proteamaculans TaxID=28151 RepID=UPI003D031467